MHAELGPDGNFRLLSNGEVVKLPPEDEENTFVADEFAEFLRRLSTNRRLVKSSSIEIQVHPVGDNRVNREPDLIVLRPEHLTLMTELKKGAILFGAPPPLLIAEMVSPGGEGSDKYRRDYEWKREQYEWWQIPEYWIIDRHRAQVVICTLKDEAYTEQRYTGSDIITSSGFLTLKIAVDKLLSGDIL